MRRSRASALSHRNVSATATRLLIRLNARNETTVAALQTQLSQSGLGLAKERALTNVIIGLNIRDEKIVQILHKQLTESFDRMAMVAAKTLLRLGIGDDAVVRILRDGLTSGDLDFSEDGPREYADAFLVVPTEDPNK